MKSKEETQVDVEVSQEKRGEDNNKEKVEETKTDSSENIPIPVVPFPQRFKKAKDESNFQKFVQILKKTTH